MKIFVHLFTFLLFVSSPIHANQTTNSDFPNFFQIHFSRYVNHLDFNRNFVPLYSLGIIPLAYNNGLGSEWSLGKIENENYLTMKFFYQKKYLNNKFLFKLSTEFLACKYLGLLSPGFGFSVGKLDYFIVSLKVSPYFYVLNNENRFYENRIFGQYELFMKYFFRDRISNVEIGFFSELERVNVKVSAELNFWRNFLIMFNDRYYSKDRSHAFMIGLGIVFDNNKLMNRKRQR